MKLLYTFLLVAAFSFVSIAQSFQFDPTDNYVGISPLNQYKNHYVFMENLTGGSLDLAWTRLSFDFPEEWESTLCDYGNCYVGIPESGQMLSVEDTTRGYLRITLNPYDRLGTGNVSFYVYDIKEPGNGDTVSFTITSETLTKLDENVAGHRVKVFPNPAANYVNVDLSDIDASSVSIINLQGKSVLVREINTKEQFRFDVTDLPRGIYLINIKTKSEEILNEKIFIQ